MFASARDVRLRPDPESATSGADRKNLPKAIQRDFALSHRAPGETPSHVAATERCVLITAWSAVGGLVD
jgi:hypothetical protein